eukprot:Hpha_TRINITY_DN3039_c0_g2::TRINITY_DN3039_c0_g2_i1::g.138508::m.138508
MAALLGQTVQTFGLSRAELNGLTGTVVRLQGNRVVVSLPPPHLEKALMPDNLSVVPRGQAPKAGFFANSVLQAQRVWGEMNQHSRIACFAVLLLLVYWLLIGFGGRGRSHSYDPYHYDDYDSYSSNYGYSGGGGFGLPSIGTIVLMGAMFYGWRSGMNPWQLLMMYNFLGGGMGCGRRRRGFF